MDAAYEAKRNDMRRFIEGSSVCVVIVNYRTASLAVSCVRSLEEAAALDPALRVVVVDNDSQDESFEFIEAALQSEGLSRFAMCVPAPRNGGYAYGNNLVVREGLSADTPPRYFWLLNPDCEARPGAAEALKDFLDQHPDVGIAGSCLLEPDGSAWATAFRFPSVLGELDSGVRLGVLSRLLSRWVVAMKMGDEPARVDWLPGASMMVRREVFSQIGLMDEEYFLYYEETDFCLRAFRAGFSCWYVPESRVMHIAGQSTGVTSRTATPKRRPQYVFDSRHRYFVKNHGLGYAILADLAWTSGFATWRLRRLLQGREDQDPPSLLVDSLRNHALLRLVR